ncbi:MAG: BrnT family toxin [Moorea sp. SIO3G5]|nr:BrnT family toxin [Moorena sp. SIO3G5]
MGNRESGIGNRESGIGNRESGIGNRESGIGNRGKIMIRCCAFKLDIIQVNAFGPVLVVVYTWRGDQIRLILARKATRTERKQYLEG